MNVMLLIPVIVTALVWIFSLRRTPFALGWFFCSIGVAGAGMTIMAAISQVHHTAVGIVAGALAASVLPAATAACVEVLALDPPGQSDVAAWRAAHRRAPRRIAGPPPPAWIVQSCALANSGDVEIYVVRPGSESRRRAIGRADPVENTEEFMNLRVKAEQAAETLNALKVE